MTVDLVHANNNAIAVLGSANDALARLGEWVEAARHAHQLVAPLVGTAFIPDSYRPKVSDRATDKEKQAAYDVAVANATAAVLQGVTLGLDPLVSLQQIYIVHGRPGMYAKMMVALIQSKGHEVWTEDLSDTRAVVAGRRKGSEHTERITITMDMARKARWTTNAKYAETPQDMLWARAASRVCDRIASDVLKGVASVEEIQDEIGQQNGNGTRTVTPRKRVTATTRAALPAAVGPSLDDDPDDECPGGPAPTVEPDPEPDLEPDPEPSDTVNGAQLRMMHALFREVGIAERTDRLQYVNEVLAEAVGPDRTVASASELTKREAGCVIDKLQSFADQLDPKEDA